MSIFFTSDPHYFHANVIKYCNRPFPDVEKMNIGLVKAWNSVVGKDDIVYILGDFSLAFRPVEIFPNMLNGTMKYLIPGNHDFCHSYNKKSRTPENHAKWIGKYNENGLEVLPEHSTLDIPGVAVVNMAHLPYTNIGDVRLDAVESGHDKYAKFRPIDDGRVLLCGHVHEKWKIRKSPKGSLMINVGVDVWDMKPVHIDEVKRIILENK